MSERERSINDTPSMGSAPGRRDQQLQALYEAVYPPAHLTAEPSQSVERRVAELAAAHHARAARRAPGWSVFSTRGVLAAGAAALALLIVMIAMGFPRRGRDRIEHARTVAQVHPASPKQAPPAVAPPRLTRVPDDGSEMAPARPGQPSPKHGQMRRSPPSSASRQSPGTVGSAMPSPRPHRVPAVRDDLDYVSGDPAEGGRLRARLSPDEWDRIEARLRRDIQVRDDFVSIPLPRLASADDHGLAAAAVESYRREAAIVDARLSREVTLAYKATALSDLCDRLRAETGIRIAAGPSVADEKVTVFCEKMPLRDVMRQLARPFGYTWLRSGAPAGPSNVSGEQGGYRYELVQDLRSQLLEEELRNRDRNTALIALEREVERYRPYLGLTPDEALARSRSAAPAEKKLLEQLASYGWGPVQMYYRLSTRELAALRAGEQLTFSSDPKPGEDPLPPEVARGVFQTMRDWRLYRRDDAFHLNKTGRAPADAKPPGSVEGTVATVTLSLRQRELGEFTLGGNSGFYTTGTRGPDINLNMSTGAVAVGRSSPPTRPGPVPAAPAAADPELRRRVSLRPEPTCPLPPSLITSDTPAALLLPRVTSTEVLEAVHRETGLPIVADYYTRFRLQRDVSPRDQPLAQALDQVSEALRLRWNRDGEWLQFRSATYYDDRLKEVPNRLLARWSAARQRQGMLTLDDLLEIAQLSNAQLDGSDSMAGAILCSGLLEWSIARSRSLRPHLRYLATLTPAQRQEAMSPGGLTFPRLSFAQQQQFIALGIGASDAPMHSLDELAGAALRVDYTQPGWFEWSPPGLTWFQWVVPIGQSRRALRPPVHERSREAALQAARQIEATYHSSMLRAAQRIHPELDEAHWQQQASQIVPTELDLTVIYMPGASHDRALRVIDANSSNSWATWETSISRRE